MARFIIGLLILFVAVGILVALTAPGYVFYTGAGHDRKSAQYAEHRSENTAKTAFDIESMDLEQQRIRGLITESQYQRGMANARGVLNVAIENAKNPSNGACQSELQVVGLGVTDSPLPASCPDGFEFPVWSEGPHKVLKAEWRTPGGLFIAGEPQLVAGYKSVAKPLGGNRWEVEGIVSYRHTHAADNIVLRIVVE